MQRKKIGHIVGTFGLKGAFKVVLLTDVPQLRFKRGNSIEFAQHEFIVNEFHVKNAHLGLVSVETLTDINEILPYIGKDIYAQVEPQPGTIFIDDLIGLTILDSTAKKIDAVKDVVKMNSCDYLLLDSGKYLPFLIGKFIESPDFIKKTITLTKLGQEAYEL